MKKFLFRDGWDGIVDDVGIRMERNEIENFKTVTRVEKGKTKRIIGKMH